MRIFSREFEHPTQAGRVRLNIFEEPGRGYLATEERRGTVTVVATRGLFGSREEALARIEGRAQELVRQRYRAVAPSA
jgi:hypothetical protein